MNSLLSDRWSPKLLLVLRRYTGHDFASDLIAGITVGLVALPLAMAFAIASGVTPQAGLYTAVVAGFVISALGGSRVQIGGPTGAFVVIVAGIVAKFGVSGLLIVTVMAGVILVVMGLTGLGTAVKFIPRPITIGFTNGIAILIASTQIKDFLGLRIGTVPSEFVARMSMLAKNLLTLQWQTVALSTASIALILVPRLSRRIPGSIVPLLAAVESLLSRLWPIACPATVTTRMWNWWRKALPIWPRRSLEEFQPPEQSPEPPPTSDQEPNRRSRA